MFAHRRTTVLRLQSRVISNLRARNNSSQKVETPVPVPAAEARQQGPIVQQQTQIAVAPQPAKAPPEDDGLYWTALGLLLVTPPVVWFYYQHRKEHMGKKKEEVLRKLAEKRAAFQKEMGK